MGELIATCCCTELPLKLLQQFGVAPLFALSIQPQKVTASPSGVDDALAQRLVLGSFEAQCYAHLLPGMVRVPTSPYLHAKWNDSPALNGVNAALAIFFELSEVRLLHVLLPRRSELDVDQLLQLVGVDQAVWTLRHRADVSRKWLILRLAVYGHVQIKLNDPIVA